MLNTRTQLFKIVALIPFAIIIIGLLNHLYFNEYNFKFLDIKYIIAAIGIVLNLFLYIIWFNYGTIGTFILIFLGMFNLIHIFHVTWTVTVSLSNILGYKFESIGINPDVFGLMILLLAINYKSVRKIARWLYSNI